MRSVRLSKQKEQGSVTMTMALETNLATNHVCFSSCCVLYPPPMFVYVCAFAFCFHFRRTGGKKCARRCDEESTCRRMVTKRGAEERFVDGRRDTSWKRRTGWGAEMRMQGKLIGEGGILIMSPDVSKWSFDKFPSPSATLPPSFHMWTCHFAKALSSLCTFAKSMSKLCVGFCSVSALCAHIWHDLLQSD